MPQGNVDDLIAEVSQLTGSMASAVNAVSAKIDAKFNALSAQIAALQGSGSVGITTSPSTLTVAGGAGAGMEIAVLSAPSLAQPVTFSIISPSGRYAISAMNKLVVGLVEIDALALNGSDTVAVRATAADGITSITSVLPITVTMSGGIATVDLNFVTGVYSGATLADVTNTQAAALSELDSTGATVNFGVNEVRRTDLGIHTVGSGVSHIGTWSKDPGTTHWTLKGWTAGTRTQLSAQSDGFVPIEFTPTDYFGSRIGPVPTRPLVVDEHLTIKVRVKHKTGQPANTGCMVVFNFGAPISAFTQWFVDDLTVSNPTVVNNDAAACVITAPTAVKNADGTVEITGVVKARQTDMEFSVSTCDRSPAVNTNILLGYDIIPGDVSGPWIATTTSTVTGVGDDYQIGGALATIAHGTTGWIGLEVQELTYACMGAVSHGGSGTAGKLLTVGAQDLLKPAGPTAFSVLGGASQALGLGGWRGIVRIVITWDAGGGFSVYANGSKVATGSGYSKTGLVHLLNSITGRLRRIAGGPTTLTAAAAMAWSLIYNRTFTRPGKALAPGAATVTHHNGYDGTINDAIRQQSVRAFPYASDVALEASYDLPARGTPPAGGVGDVIFMPRFSFYTSSADGMHSAGAINGEKQAYIDRAQAGAYDAFDIASSCLRIHVKRYAELTAGQQAHVPIETATSAPYAYVSGCLSTPGQFTQPTANGAVFSSRDKTPHAGASWPQWWLFNASLGEIDIEEYYGQDPNRTTWARHDFNSSVHENFYKDMTFDLSLDFHDRTVLVKGSSWTKYFDGEDISGLVPMTSNMQAQPFHLLYDFAIQSWAGAETDTALTGVDIHYDIDRTTVLQLGQ